MTALHTTSSDGMQLADMVGGAAYPSVKMVLIAAIACGVHVVSLVRLMLFMTTIKILMVRTGSVQSCHQTPFFPYRGRARQTTGNTGALLGDYCTFHFLIAPRG